MQPHESQQARPPCPSPTPGVHSDSCPSSSVLETVIQKLVVGPQKLKRKESKQKIIISQRKTAREEKEEQRVNETASTLNINRLNS